MISMHVTTNVGIATTYLTLDTDGYVANVTARCGSRVSNEITITCAN